MCGGFEIGSRDSRFGLKLIGLLVVWADWQMSTLDVQEF